MRTIKELSEEIASLRLSPVKLTEEIIKRIERLNPIINCYITILREDALIQAERAEREINNGIYRGPLHGIPIAVKDIIYIRGVRCTAGSKILENNVADHDAPIITRLRESGCIIVGTTNLHEFASGVTNVNPFYGAVRNPWDITRISGGSSGGSAAAVCAGLAIASLGTDTSGSVRIPAALCGVVGLKPTYNLINKDGIIPLAPSFDTVGLLTSSAWDAACLLNALVGYERSTKNKVDRDYLKQIDLFEKELKIGIPKNYFFDLIDEGVEEEFSRFLDKLRSLVTDIREVMIQDVESIYDVWFAIRRAEASAFHDTWLTTMPERYGEDVRRSLEKGREISAIQYIKAQNMRAKLKERFLNAMKDVDMMIVPTVPITAPKIGEDEVVIRGRRLDVYSALSRLTFPFNVIGFPVISIPIGEHKGLPVGVQIVAREFEELKILQLSHLYEMSFGLAQLPKEEKLMHSS